MTNKEIAKMLNISETTLSFIINNKPGVAEKTRGRVIDEITTLGYGHLLRKESSVLSKNICFVVHKRHGGILNQSPFYLLLMEQIEERARNSGFNLIIRVVDTNDSLDDQIRDLNASDVSGIVVFATEMLDDDMERFKKATMPVISLDNDFTRLEMDSVVINNRVGTFKAIAHLVENGHKDIGYLQCKTFINSFGERDEGFRDALKHFGLRLAPGYLFRVGYTEEESYQDFKKMIDAGSALPTALVSDDDTLTVGAMRALTECGISVPERISLVGFNDRPICRMTQPQLTSVSVPKDRFGSLAVDLLAERIANPKSDSSDYRKVEVGVQLIHRGSSRSI